MSYRSLLLALCLSLHIPTVFAVPSLIDALTNPPMPTATLPIKNTILHIEIANTPKNRILGLMFRPYLSENDGMLFIYKTERKRCFWMKNTYLPLSIAYINKQGKITDILDMQPLDTRLICPTAPMRYALEVNQGWFSRNAVKVGDKIYLSRDILRKK
ncbi:DUF192 domain-containing protein [Gallibacterium trehalosifermentans]|uniref:DUF192 domain-containing protein n=1 Tax=Gallibacterium trehalosifermentans TaxID=516935 RepID=A0ABV6H0S4_9PAST